MRHPIALPLIATLAQIFCASSASPQTVITFGETLNSSIAVSGESDSYTFTAVAGDRVMVSMAIASGGLDPEIVLYNPSGQAICSAYYPVGGATEINDCILPVNGIYTLLADDYGNSETGAYSLHLQRLNNPGGSTPLAFDQTLQATIDAVGEKDAYTFSASASDRVIVGMAIASGGLDPEIVIYNPSGQAICSAYYPVGGATEINDCILPVSGIYTLLADDYGNSETGAYSLHLQRLNNPGGFTPLAFGQTLQATIDAVGEKDAYTFSASASDRVIVGMAIASGGLDPEIVLYNPSGQAICSAYYPVGGATEINDCILPVSGIYTLLADDYGNSETGAYSLHLQRLNNPGGFTPLAFGQTLQATVDAVGEKDAYTFSASASDRLIVGMAVASGGLDPEIVLYNPSGQAICSAYYPVGGATEINDCILPVSGIYTLLADDYGNSEVGAYSLHLQRLNNPGGSTPLAFGQTLQATIDAVSEKDAYTFSASASDRVIVGMAIASGGLDPEIVIYDPSGQAICSAYYPVGGATEINDCILPVSGIYTLLADDYGNSETGAYSLHLQRLNNPGGFTPLAFGQTLQATVDAVGEKDAYTFSASASDRVMIGMAVASGGLDPEIVLYNPSGQAICSAYYPVGGATEINDCILPVSGIYTLLADDYGNSETGSYSIRLSRGPCTLTCAANVPTEGNVSTPLPFSVAAPPPSCGIPVAYHWDFGDGSASTVQNDTHSYDSEGTFPWNLTITAGDKTCNRSGSVRILPPGAEPSETVFFDGFDTYAPGSNLGGQGGWVNRFAGGITASTQQAVSSPQSARIDNGGGCFESQLYHPLPSLDVLWFSADILGVPTERSGCHEIDAMVRLYNPDAGGFESSPVAFALRSAPGEFNLGPGLNIETSVPENYVRLESDYNSLVNRWIHVQAKVDYPRHRLDIWVDGEYRGSLALNPAAPRYKGIALDAGNGLGFIDNVRVFVNGPEPGETAVELALNVPLQTTIFGNRHRYFKVTSQPDQDLLVTVDRTGPQGNLELYGSTGAPPSRAQYDSYDSTQTGAAHQSLVFQATREPKTYYFLVYQNGGTASVPFTILARHPGFHLDRVSPSTVSNTGSTTLTLIGSGFSPIDGVALISSSGGGILASATQVVSSVRMHATFNLTGAATGLYDIRIAKPLIGTADLADGLNVTAGNAGALVATLDAPANVRPDRNYTAWVRYGNRGGTDIRTPLFIITSPQNVPMRLASTEQFRRGPIQVLGVNMSGPVGVLTPGSSFSIPIEFRSATSGNQIQFDLEVMVADPIPVNWGTIETEVRPPGIADDAWSVIWSNLRTRLGVTWSDYLGTLTAASAYLTAHYHEAPGALDPNQVTPQGRLPVPVYSVRDLFSFELAKASASISPRPVLAAGLDAFYPAPGLPLAFLRVAPSPIEQRFRLGSLGRGWVHIYDYSVRVDADGSVTVREPWGQERVFLPTGDGSFSPAGSGEHATLARVGQSYLLKERDGFALSFASNRLAYMEDTNGNRLTMGYTGTALTSIMHSNGDRLTIHYNTSGRIDSVSDPAGRTTSYTYDASGEHLLEVEESGGPSTTYAYRPADATPAAHALTAITFPGGTHRYFGWDNLGRLTGEWRDEEIARLTYAYDMQGTITVRDKSTGSLNLRFGHRGQFLASEDSEGHKLALGYDPKGNPARIQDALGSSAMLTYDSHGNPLGMRDLAGNATRLTYGNLDRLASLRDARGNQIDFEYDADGNLASVEHADGSREQFSVNSAGDLASYTNRRGQTIAYDRDSRGQIIRKRSAGGVTVNYTYDARGNLDTVTDAAGTIDLDYDSRDFLTRIAYPGGKFLAFQYDDSGRRTSRTDETGFTLRYEYDATGRLARLRDTGGIQLIAYQYDAVGRLAREDRGNGTSTTYEYDSAGQVVHLIHYAPNGSIQSRFDYNYDERGNRISMATLSGTTSYEYDVLGQMVGVTYPNASKAIYEYDLLGNRVTAIENDHAEVYHVNELNQYVDAGEATFTYDEDGNLISQAGPSGGAIYEYDEKNRIVRVAKTNNSIWQYIYDDFDNRVAVIHDGDVTRYAYDPIGLFDVVAEYDGSGRLRARYVHGLGLVARINASGSAAYYGFDALGNTRQLTNDEGAIINSYDYDPWGRSLSVDEGVPNPFLYVGRLGVMNDADDLIYMRARHYLPRVGRFASMDPLMFGAGDVNFYLYSGNSPINMVDPSGKSIYFAVVAVAVVAVALEVGYYAFSAYLEARAGVSHIEAGTLNMKAWEEEHWSAATGKAGNAEALRQQAKVKERNGWIFATGGALASEALAARDGVWVVPTVVESGKLLLGKPSADPNPFGLTSFSAGKIAPPDPCMPQSQKRETESQGNQCQEKVTILSNIVRPIDPNEKTGPAPQVHSGERVTYTVYFENLRTATAPAQEVFITDHLDPDLDWSTFQLGEVAFGDVVVTSLGSRAQGTDRITYGDYSVAIEAAQSSGGGQVNWVLRTLDPDSGELPEDPFAGFLPPEDGTGRGQGHVTFSIQVRGDARPGTQVTNSASIVFDTNAPISTNTWTSTVQEEQEAPPPPDGPWLANSAVFGFRAKVRISSGSGTIAGTQVNPCIGETLCVAGALSNRAEVFIRVVGPWPNGKMWPTLVKFSTSRIQVWIEQTATGELQYYDLAAVEPGDRLLTLDGLADKLGFDPVRGAAAEAETDLGVEDANSSVGVAADPAPPSGPWLETTALPGFRTKVRIASGGGTIAGQRVTPCIAETLCVSGALPDRAEVFVRVVGPRPNGKLWPTLVKFSTSRVEVWIQQKAGGETRYYNLEQVPPGERIVPLAGLADKEGFNP